MSKRLKLSFGSDGQMCVTDNTQKIVEGEEKEKRKVCLGGSVVEVEDNNLRFVPENPYNDFDQFYEGFLKEIISMGLTQTNTNKIVDMSEQLIQMHRSMILNSIDGQANHETIETIDDTSQYVTRELRKMSTGAKRMAQYRKNPIYVEPREVSLALKWRTKTNTDSDLPSNKLVSSTCQFVSISKTLSAIFSQPDFQSMYTNYNLKDKHQCQDGIYIDVCCGTTFKGKEIFRDPNVIQLLIGNFKFI